MENNVHKIICPNCGFDGNAVTDKYCGVCYFPFEKMDSWGKIRSNYDYLVLKKSSKLINFITWSAIAMFTAGMIQMYRIYKDAVYAVYESNTINAITAHKEMVVRMAGHKSDQHGGTEQSTLRVDFPGKSIFANAEDSGRPSFSENINLEPPGEIKLPMTTVETPNFIIFSNNDRLRLELSQNIESIFNEIIKDLGFYSAWANQRKMKVYIFDNSSEYHRHSSLPEWSAGFASVSNMAIYLYESDKFNIIFPHELSHLVFSIFMENKIDLSEYSWLLEGIAVYVEMKNNREVYQYVDKYLAHLAKTGKLQRLEEMLNLNIYNIKDEEIVKKWYLQAGSLIKFIITSRGSLSFFNFCNGLKIFDGDLYKSLNYAFSGEFNTLADLEKHWIAYLRNQ